MIDDELVNSTSLSRAEVSFGGGLLIICYKQCSE